jgi:transcriptional regulator with XRE-family HTH domain
MATASLTGQWLQELREAKGLSPEEVPHAMLKARVDRRSIPSGRTIRRCETTGRRPHVRYAFGLAQFYGVDVAQLWPADERVLA